MRGHRHAALLLSALLALLLWLPAGAAQTDDPTCRRRDLESGSGAIRLCIEAPLNGSQVAGALPVAGSVEIEGDVPGLVSVTFLLDGQYLLSDPEPPYAFVLPTHLFPNGLHRLTMAADLRGEPLMEGPRVGLNIRNDAADAPPVRPTVALPNERAPAPSARPIIVAAVGDGAGGRPTADEVARLIEGWEPDLFLYLGDVYQEASPVEFYNWYDGPFGRFREITYPTIGNHEYRLDGGAAYFDYWREIPSYYSFDVAGWHFLSLNSNCERVGGCDRDSAQYQWLAREVEQPARCTLAYAHHALFAVGQNEGSAEMRPLWRRLAQAQATLVLTAHDHNYQRWEPLDGHGEADDDGVTQFVVGTGGHSLYEFEREDERLAEGVDDSFGALRLELHPGEVHYQFFDIEGELRDEGALPCQGPRRPGEGGGAASPPGGQPADPNVNEPPALAPTSEGVDAAIFDFDSSAPGTTGGQAPLAVLVALALLSVASVAVVVWRGRRAG